jgi:NPCBM-associated, NEW3 domain of alpha-galactosidase
VQLKVGRLPLILTGIDSQMCQLRASLVFDQPLIESSFQSHTRHIRFSNPYSQPIGGTLKLHAPQGWNLTPPVFNFTLNAGESFDHELTVEFPYNSIAGTQPVTADFDLQADRHIVFTEPVALTLGLSDVGTQCMAFRDGADVVVQQMVTNYGEQPINYTTYANYPGRPRIERLVTSLNPGQTTVKKYRFINVPPDQSPRIRVGLKEADGNRILNDEVEIK